MRADARQRNISGQTVGYMGNPDVFRCDLSVTLAMFAVIAVAFSGGHRHKMPLTHKARGYPMRKFVLMGAAMLALSACSEKGADADGDGKITNAEAETEMTTGGAMEMKPGLWEVKISFSKIEAPGAPTEMQAKMKAQLGKGMTQRSCLTKEQVDKPGMEFFGAPAGANCNFDELDRSAGGVKMSMTCKPNGALVMKSKMDGKFAAETYTLNIEQNTEGAPMGAIKMNGKIEGKRVGDCPV